MKITKVEPLHVGQFMFARITTDGGLVGFGEAGAWGHIEASGAAIARFAEYLEGKDPFAIEHHWNVTHRFSYFQGLVVNAAISAIDIALWDIKGKALKVPIYELLGGSVRNKARIYGHIYESSIEKVLDECLAKMQAGFNAFGHLNPFLDEGTTRSTSRRTSRRCAMRSRTCNACARSSATASICWSSSIGG